MRSKSFLWPVFLFMGCAGSVYQPLKSGIGYSEVAIGQDRYEINFHATTDQDEVSAKNFALVRAAEIGKHNGFSYFSLVREKTREKHERDVKRVTEARTHPRDPYFYPRHYWPRRSVTRTVVTTRTRPIVKIIVAYKNENYLECLSVDSKLQEATAAGILK